MAGKACPFFITTLSEVVTSPRSPTSCHAPNGIQKYSSQIFNWAHGCMAFTFCSYSATGWVHDPLPWVGSSIRPLPHWSLLMRLASNEGPWQQDCDWVWNFSPWPQAKPSRNSPAYSVPSWEWRQETRGILGELHQYLIRNERYRCLLTVLAES